MNSNLILSLLVIAVGLSQAFHEDPHVAPDERNPPALPNDCQVVDDVGVCTTEEYPDGEEGTQNRDLYNAERVARSMEDSLKAIMEGDSIEKSLFSAVTQEPVSLIPAEVSLCPEHCWNYFYWVWANGQWWKVVQTDGFRQYIRYCRCLTEHCHGRLTNRHWWSGRCRLETYWKLVLVYDWHLWQFRWIWVKMHSGCCCIPNRYAGVMRGSYPR